MGQFSLVHWLILGVILVLVFGGGRFSSMMGDVAKGIKQFKKGMSEDAEVKPAPPAKIESRLSAPAETVATPEAERAREG